MREIPDKPKALYVRGELPGKDYAYLCVVGSRTASLYARRAVQTIVAGLRGYKVAVVSGLALGLDGEAHKAALAAGLPTVAVLPSSCDDASIYPRSNLPLAQEIVRKGGALVSEYGEPYRPQLFDFPKRNRIGAGMSKSTLIAEAAEKSGTLITARLALDYNREVLAVPHELLKETGTGSNRLIREGATLVRSAEDVLEALGIKQKEDTKLVTLPPDLSAEEARVLHALTEPLVRDELIEHSNLSAQEANVALSSLLIRGLIAERLGKVERI